ncbi:fungal specific transcription factor domain-containing protein [Trichoderma breve]|uniref:Fungal specific transcription factor domain-containing protein n=1 Tax=Trichoderma breve TaxID=2034170 RepID=A0A9W9E4K7_9HYPO|nr:fungal specific transcription factor domain-containing protein [Trichoderma breve]KAJ4854481.1 fungal specific transcription factor domain-containing protein [Trichoderma breve]
MADSDVTISKPRGQKSCLNCKNRKIACDRLMPVCSSCKRRKKICSGYDYNLSWPRDGDERRAMTVQVRSQKYRANTFAFLNTSNVDVMLYYETNFRDSLTNNKKMSVWIPSPTRSPQLPRFGSNKRPLYDTEISSAVRLITSRGDLRQDVCGLLRRMALTDNGISSLAVRYAMNAISYLYLRMPDEAMMHQMRAVSALQGAIDRIVDPRCRAQAIAASLLLSLYESSYHGRRETDGENTVLLDWVFYHNVLYKFSLQHWQKRTPEMVAIAQRDMLIAKIVSLDHFHTIHSTLGCSLELMEFLSQAIDLIKDRDDPDYLSKSHSHAIYNLEGQIRDMGQQLCSGIDREDYHLAVLIYLDRVVRGSLADSRLSRTSAEEALDLLSNLGLCERPFIMIMLALQAESDSDRLLVLSALKNAITERPLSNLASTEQIIRRIWVQQDLYGSGQADALKMLNTIISSNDIPPSFT